MKTERNLSEKFMDEAIALAKEGAAEGEVPVGCVVVCDGAVVSVGNNGYGHPAPEVLERLGAASAKIYRTDESGAIIVDIFEDGSTLISTVLSPEE